MKAVSEARLKLVNLMGYQARICSWQGLRVAVKPQSVRICERQVSRLVGRLCAAGHLPAAEVCELHRFLAAQSIPGTSPTAGATAVAAEVFETSSWCTSFVALSEAVSLGCNTGGA